MGDPEYIYRRYREGDENQILEVLTKAFKKWPLHQTEADKSDYWKWKHKSNPNGKVIIAVIEFQGNVVACWHRQVAKHKIGEQEVLSSQGVDVAMLPEHQGKGLSKYLLPTLAEIEKHEQIIKLFYSPKTSSNSFICTYLTKNSFPLFVMLISFFFPLQFFSTSPLPTNSPRYIFICV